ncbi:hypothetical protein [Bradyrhizobium sp. BR 1433]|uniref:hypothetical protein n=1 Tax=Bradyrhizobium sp. BR 1433 TaxID=3447967 RepID=UPI003EE5EF63
MANKTATISVWPFTEAVSTGSNRRGCGRQANGTDKLKMPHIERLSICNRAGALVGVAAAEGSPSSETSCLTGIIVTLGLAVVCSLP